MRILITGGAGMLAHAVREVLLCRGHEALSCDRSTLDVTVPADVKSTLSRTRPEAVIHCAAYTAVDDAEANEAAAFRINAESTGILAEACRDARIRLVYPSSDYVFDGKSRTPYRPDAEPNPLNVYGRTKLEGERMTSSAPSWLVVRTSWLYGLNGRHFPSSIVKRAQEHGEVRVVTDQVGAPTWCNSVAEIISGLLESGAPNGIYHATNEGQASWYDFACEVLRLAAVPASIVPIQSDSFPRPAKRPSYSVLDCTSTEPFVPSRVDWRKALHAAVEAGLLQH